LAPFHGKAVALNIEDAHAPDPLLLLVHEYRVRGRNFLQPTADVEVTSAWQEWMVKGGIVNDGEGGTFTFNREAPSQPSTVYCFTISSLLYTDDYYSRSTVWAVSTSFNTQLEGTVSKDFPEDAKMMHLPTFFCKSGPHAKKTEVKVDKDQMVGD